MNKKPFFKLKDVHDKFRRQHKLIKQRLLQQRLTAHSKNAEKLHAIIQNPHLPRQVKELLMRAKESQTIKSESASQKLKQLKRKKDF